MHGAVWPLLPAVAGEYLPDPPIAYREMKRRPDWTWMNYNGTDSSGHWLGPNSTTDAPDGMLHMCLNAPGYIEKYANMTAELIVKYKVKAVRYDGLMLPVHVGQCGLTEPDTRKRLDAVRSAYSTVVRKLREAAVKADPAAQTWFSECNNATVVSQSNCSDIFQLENVVRMLLDLECC